MKIESTKILSINQKESIICLWNKEYPQQLAHHSLAEFDEYLSKLCDIQHFLLIDELNEIKGWFALFTRENEKWFAMIVDSSQQKKGYGSMLIKNAKSIENELNGWVIDHENYTKLNGEKYNSPLNFYLKNGFEIISNKRLETEKLSALKIHWKKI
jgi:GNAT superfamily N-acetyltransferase